MLLHWMYAALNRARRVPAEPAEHAAAQVQMLVRSAVLRGDLRQLDELARRHGSASVRDDADPDSLTTLHAACACGDATLVRYLLAAPILADARALRGNRFTPLHAAAMYGRTEVCGVLLDAGAKIDAQTEPQRYAPLHGAATEGHEETVRLLLARGANPALRNHRGETPAEAALRLNRPRCAALLANLAPTLPERDAAERQSCDAGKARSATPTQALAPLSAPAPNRGSRSPAPCR